MKNTTSSRKLSTLPVLTKTGVLICALLTIPMAYAESESENKSLLTTTHTPPTDSKRLDQEIRDAVVDQLSINSGLPQKKITADNTDTEDETTKSTKSAPVEKDSLSQNTETNDKSPEVIKLSSTEKVTANNDAEKDNKKSSAKPKLKKKKRSAVQAKVLSKGEITTINYIMIMSSRNNKNKLAQSSGWIYLGNYIKKSWTSKNIDIENTLPKIGLTYALKHPLNMREALPKKASTSKLIKTLRKDTNVKIIDIHPSGRNGHYWALIKEARPTKKR